MPFLERLNRYWPLLTLILVLAALVQLFTMAAHWLQQSGAAQWLSSHVVLISWILGAVAAICWMIAILALLRATGRLPRWLSERRTLVDILDRLTNRGELERRIAEQVDT